MSTKISLLMLNVAALASRHSGPAHAATDAAAPQLPGAAAGQLRNAAARQHLYAAAGQLPGAPVGQLPDAAGQHVLVLGDGGDPQQDAWGDDQDCPSDITLPAPNSSQLRPAVHHLPMQLSPSGMAALAQSLATSAAAHGAGRGAGTGGAAVAVCELRIGAQGVPAYSLVSLNEGDAQAVGGQMEMQLEGYQQDVADTLALLPQR